MCIRDRCVCVCVFERALMLKPLKMLCTNHMVPSRGGTKLNIPTKKKENYRMSEKCKRESETKNNKEK